MGLHQDDGDSRPMSAIATATDGPVPQTSGSEPSNSTQTGSGETKRVSPSAAINLRDEKTQPDEAQPRTSATAPPSKGAGLTGGTTGNDVDGPKKTSRTSEDQPATQQTSPVAQPSSTPPTIADLLTGVRLPRNLLPVVPAGEKASDQRISLLSDDVEPEIIGVAIADELERLGYEIHTITTDQAMAKRGDQRLGLQIFPTVADLTNDSGSRFPDADPASVAIDLWVVAD